MVKKWLDTIRKPSQDIKRTKKIINSLLILGLGIILGIFSKWLDNISINDTIWWQHILGLLDLRNVFSLFGIWIFLAVTISVFSKTPLRASLNVFLFFLGMTISYHLYTIIFSGFNPKRYMMIWYIITLLTPILAFICWYSKGNNKISLILCCGILAIMMLSSFGIGMWYFDFKSIIDTILFIATIIVLYTNPKNSVYSFFGALILTYTISILI